MRVARGGTARVEFEVRFPRATKGRNVEAGSEPQESPTPKPAPPQAPKITRLLVLGYHFDRLVQDGVVKNYAEIARLSGLSRARVTQIVNLILLAPKIQENILGVSSRRITAERPTRSLTSIPDWRSHSI